MSSNYPRRTDHPYRAEIIEDIPTGLWRQAEPLLQPDDPLHSIVVIPAQMLPQSLENLGDIHKVPEQALFFTDRGLWHIQGAISPEQPGQATYLKGCDLMYAHLSLVLLYGRLELCSVAHDTLTRIVVEYNTVRHDLIQPEMQRLLRLAWRSPGDAGRAGDESPQRVLAEVGQKSFKFGNGLQDYALQPNDPLLGYVFQPDIMRSYLRLFRRQVAPSVLLALTQNQLIFMEDGMTAATRYALFFTFCPRVCIAGVDIRPDALWQDVSINLGKGNATAVRQTRVEDVAARDWQALWSSHR